MAKKSSIERNDINKLKFKGRKRNRCNICGRPRGYIRKFGICRICFRDMAGKGILPGVKKASW